jgi:predicted acetyltransferase
MELVRPTAHHLVSYADALERGWSPDNIRLRDAALEQLERIARDPSGFLDSLDDREARGAPVKMLEGTMRPRLPGYVRWMWDGEFCGTINLRWQNGSSELPPWCLGHVGYSVVPWKERRGYGTAAVRQLLPHARREGLGYLEITTDTGNIASQKIITTNGGVLVKRFVQPDYGGVERLRYRIPL